MLALQLAWIFPTPMPCSPCRSLRARAHRSTSSVDQLVRLGTPPRRRGRRAGRRGRSRPPRARRSRRRGRVGRARPARARPRRRAGERDADVGRTRALARRRSRDGVRRRVPRRPQPRARGRVALGDDVGRALGLRDRGDELEIGRDHPLATGRLDEERRPGWEVGAVVRVDRCDRPAVEQLDASDAGTGGDDRVAARQAASTSGNEIRRTTACSGIPWSRSVSSVITASVPSEPIRRPRTSYPAEVFGARLPARTTRPSASTASSASTFARIFP